MPSLEDTFNNPATTTRNPATLARRAKASLKAATAFLRDQASAQITRQNRRPPEEAYAPTGAPRGEYLADVVYLREYAGVNKKRECILTLLGVNSRYVYARALTKATSAKAAEALEEILEQNRGDSRGGVVAPISHIRSDGGPEFAGEFAALLKKRRIPHEKGQPGTHARLGRLDRYHGVLRRKLGELFAMRDSHVWVDALQDLVDNHNKSPSRPLAVAGRGLSPADIGPEEESKLISADRARAAALRSRVDVLGIEPGTRVRLLTAALKKAPRFIKGQEATWTPELYTVEARAGVNTFQIDVPAGENTIWPAHALQRVTKAVGQERAGPKVDVQVERAKRMERRNISEPEQAAALAAPARPKRVPKLTAKAAAAAEEKAAAIISEAERKFAKTLTALSAAAPAPAAAVSEPPKSVPAARVADARVEAATVVAERAPRRVIRPPKRFRD